MYWRRLWFPWAAAFVLALVILASYSVFFVTSEVCLPPILDSKHGSAFISQLPKQRPRGVLFLAHDCGSGPEFFWDPSRSCPHCLGLPENRVYVHTALERHYAVISISSAGTCWDRRTDTPIVISILSWWIQQNRLENLPVFGVGKSYGGPFISMLSLSFRFTALALLVSEGSFSKFAPPKYPPTIFAHMPRNSERAVAVGRSMALLRNSRVNTTAVECGPVPVNDSFFSQRVPGLDLNLSERIYGLLRQTGRPGSSGGTDGHCSSFCHGGMFFLL